jgi:hypothetical protein
VAFGRNVRCCGGAVETIGLRWHVGGTTAARRGKIDAGVIERLTPALENAQLAAGHPQVNGLDPGENAATLTNRGSNNHQPPPNNHPKCNDVPRHLSTVSRDITSVGPVGLEPTTRGLKGAGRESMRMRRLKISRAGMPESRGVAVNAAVRQAK